MSTLYKQKDYDSSPIISNDPVFFGPVLLSLLKEFAYIHCCNGK